MEKKYTITLTEEEKDIVEDALGIAKVVGVYAQGQ